MPATIVTAQEATGFKEDFSLSSTYDSYQQFLKPHDNKTAAHKFVFANKPEILSRQYRKYTAYYLFSIVSV
jgi:hypothetical protein